MLFFFVIKYLYCFIWGWKILPDGCDGISYNNYAMAILNNTDWITNPAFEGSYRAPLYPLFLSVVYFFFGAENFMAVYLVQCIISTITLYYIYKLAYRVAGKKIACFSLVWSGFYIYYYYYSGTILRETVVQFLIIFLFYNLYIFMNIKEKFFFKIKYFWISVLSTVILTHVDAKYIFYIPFIFLLIYFRKKNFHYLKRASYYCFFVCVLMVPWTIRNYIAYDRIVIVNTRTLDKFVSKIFKINNKSDNKKIVRMAKDIPSDKERDLIKKGGNPFNRSKEEVALVLNDVYPPNTFIGKAFSRAKEMWWPFRFSYDYNSLPPKLRGPYSFMHNAISIVFYGPLIFLFICGCWLIFISKDWKYIFILYPVLVHALLHFVALSGRERHRMQIDSFIIIIAMYSVFMIFKKIQDKTRLFGSKAVC